MGGPWKGEDRKKGRKGIKWAGGSGKGGKG